ncbi:MAG TPA: multicopper oxidase domain-containing protein [Solirubrobacteraceae bacterium]|nr:multicopper oxidase domain-containing protein [Solirubrobacteraceae bacterium]
MMDRRSFLGAAGAGLLLCTVDGRTVQVTSAKDVEDVDRAAAALRQPGSARAAQEGGEFPTPEPQAGGRAREFWLAARPVRWTIAPASRDEWMKKAIPEPSTFGALVYQQYSAGFAAPIGPAEIPGPTLRAEVGDTIVVHFRNDAESFNQALTVHPHGVRYNPEYDGSYLGDFTRAGGFVAPGEEFTYVWECTPQAVGAWPYHDHGPNHTLNTFRGLFGAIIVREKGDPGPEVQQVLYMHSFPPPVTNLEVTYQCLNGRTGAGNTPTVQARVGQDVAWYVFGGDSNFHTFHVHGHRWRGRGGAFEDCPTFGPNETLIAAWREDNPGRWLYHCHVFTHQDAGMAGWYLVDP